MNPNIGFTEKCSNCFLFLIIRNNPIIGIPIPKIKYKIANHTPNKQSRESCTIGINAMNWVITIDFKIFIKSRVTINILTAKNKIKLKQFTWMHSFPHLWELDEEERILWWALQSISIVSASSFEIQHPYTKYVSQRYCYMESFIDLLFYHQFLSSKISKLSCFNTDRWLPRL